MWPRPHAEPRLPRRETLPRAKVIDFDELPARCDTKLAGLLLAVPDLVALDLPGIVAAAGYPGTRQIPAVSSVLSLLALKLVGVRRVSHVDDLAADPDGGPVRRTRRAPQGDRPDHLQLPAHPRTATPLPRRARPGDARRRPRRRRRLRPGLPRRDALGRRRRPRKALRTTAFPAHPLRAHLLRPRRRHPQPRLRQRRHLQSHPGPRGPRLLRPLARPVRHRPDHPRARPARHHPRRARRTRRPRHPLHHPAHALSRPATSHQQHRPRRLAHRRPRPRRQLPQTPSRRRTSHHHRLPRHRPPTRRPRPRPRHPDSDHHQRPPLHRRRNSSNATPAA